MILPDINLDNLRDKISQLEHQLAGLDPELDYREKFMVELQLSFYYRMVMFESGPASGHVRQSRINCENVTN